MKHTSECHRENGKSAPHPNTTRRKKPTETGNDAAGLSESLGGDLNRHTAEAEQVEVGSHGTGVQVETHTGGAPDVCSRGEASLPPPEANRVSCRLQVQTGGPTHWSCRAPACACVCVCVNSNVPLHQSRLVTTHHHLQHQTSLKAVLHHQMHKT